MCERTLIWSRVQKAPTRRRLCAIWMCARAYLRRVLRGSRLAGRQRPIRRSRPFLVRSWLIVSLASPFMGISRQLELMIMDLLTYSLGEPPANPSQPQESARDWMTRAATSHSAILPWLNANAPAGWSGKTCPAFCHPTEEGTLEPSSGAWSNAGMGSPTASLTLSISEFPSGAVVSSLSDILQADGPDLLPYSLSAKACAGILRRAVKRGKTVPAPLEEALKAVVSEQPISTTPAPSSPSGQSLKEGGV